MLIADHEKLTFFFTIHCVALVNQQITSISGPPEGKGRRKANPKDFGNAVQNNSVKKPAGKNTTKKQASLSSVSNKTVKQEKVKSEFVIPELPIGRLLEMKVYSNWGDKQFVGLNGIELFDSGGKVVDIEKVSIAIKAV